MRALASSLVERMPALTVQRSAARSLANAQDNRPYIERSILDPAVTAGRDGHPSALVIAAGPSLHLRDPVAQILKRGYPGVVVSVDGALGYCLRNGLVPHYVVVLDPHPSRVARWLGDPELESREDDDDYFRRQDLDPYLGVDERRKNRELIELVNRHGPRIRAIVSTSVSMNVTRRCREAGMAMFWWNPLLDDVDAPESMTRRLHAANGMPCMVSGGNVGTAAWVFAHQVLGKREVALVGMDLSYAPGTPLENTQYYKEIAELFGPRAADAYVRVYNPHLKATWYADPAYYWYRQSFLEMARAAECVTLNCTEGGILFGKGVRFLPLKTFLARSAPKRREG